MIKSEQFDCPRCGLVKFRFPVKQHFADELAHPIAETRDDIIDFGGCQVARDARIPKRPDLAERQNCPYLKNYL